MLEYLGMRGLLYSGEGSCSGEGVALGRELLWGRSCSGEKIEVALGKELLWGGNVGELLWEMLLWGGNVALGREMLLWGWSCSGVK